VCFLNATVQLAPVGRVGGLVPGAIPVAPTPAPAASGTFGCYPGVRGMWVDKGCRGVFQVDARASVSGRVTYGVGNDKSVCLCKIL
jgi:hypothetical protein